MTAKQVIKIIRASVVGIGFLFFGLKAVVSDYKIDKRIVAETYLDSASIKSYVTQDLTDYSKGLAAAKSNVVFTLADNKQYYSDQFMPVFLHADFDTTLFNTGQKAVFRVSKNLQHAGIPQFVELSINGKQLLNTEEGFVEYKKFEGKYFLLIFGFILTLGGVLFVYFRNRTVERS